MIRINLLPVRRRRVEETIRKEVTLFFILIAVLVGAMAYVHMGHTREIERITREKKAIDQKINRYRSWQKQLKKLEEQKQVLEKKLDIIEQLRRNRDLPVRVLDQLATLIPPDKMWVKTLTQKGNILNIDGVAQGNETIAQFMESLAASPYFDADQVVLKQSRQVVFEEYKLKGFNLSCRIVTPKEEKPTKQAQN
jgi:type IV pilus assembly protein PilN